jgi:hypothetical protein
MKRIAKKILLSLLVCIFLALSLSACGKKDPLVGIWLEPVSGIQMKFGEDGSLVISRSGASFTVQYEEQNPNIIAITSSGTDPFPVKSVTYQVTQDTLIVTMDNVQTIFTRVK